MIMLLRILLPLRNLQKSKSLKNLSSQISSYLPLARFFISSPLEQKGKSGIQVKMDINGWGRI